MTSTRETSDLSQITVTPAARDAIKQLVKTNGDILFHLPGGCCDARTPICLPVDELKIGPRDTLIGHADGIPIYEMTGGEQPNSRAAFELGVTNGVPVGFSLLPGDGKCFSLRETRS